MTLVTGRFAVFVFSFHSTLDQLFCFWILTSQMCPSFATSYWVGEHCDTVPCALELQCLDLTRDKNSPRPLQQHFTVHVFVRVLWSSSPSTNSSWLPVWRIISLLSLLEGAFIPAERRLGNVRLFVCFNFTAESTQSLFVLWLSFTRVSAKQ